MVKLTKSEKIKVGIAATLILLVVAVPVLDGITGGWRLPLFGIHLDSEGTPGSSYDPTTLEEPVERTHTFDAASVRDFDIAWHGGTVEIKRGAVDEVVVREEIPAGSYIMDPTRATADIVHEGVLQIDDRLPDDGGDTYPASHLTIELPEETSKALGSISVESIVADISIQNVTCEEVGIDSASSACTLRGFTADVVSIDTVHGSVTVNGTVTSVLEINTVSGKQNIQLVGTLPGDILLDSVGANATLKLPEDAGFTVKAATVSGDVSSDRAINTVRDDGTYVYGDGATAVTFDSVTGSLSVV